MNSNRGAHARMHQPACKEKQKLYGMHGRNLERMAGPLVTAGKLRSSGSIGSSCSFNLFLTHLYVRTVIPPFLLQPLWCGGYCSQSDACCVQVKASFVTPRWHANRCAWVLQRCSIYIDRSGTVTSRVPFCSTYGSMHARRTHLQFSY